MSTAVSVINIPVQGSTKDNMLTADHE